MGEKICAVKINAGASEFEVIHDFESSLANMQDAVGGWIEAFPMEYISDNNRQIVIWLNEEGKLKSLEENIYVFKNEKDLIDIIVGDVIVTAVDEEGNTVGLTDDEVDYVEENIHIDSENKCNLMFI